MQKSDRMHAIYRYLPPYTNAAYERCTRRRMRPCACAMLAVAACAQPASAADSGKATATCLSIAKLLRRDHYACRDAVAATMLAGAVLLSTFLVKRSLRWRLEPPVAFVIVAKWPSAGVAKTRLAAALCATRSVSADAALPAEEAAAAFAQASLTDLLSRFGRADLSPRIQRCLLYAPPNEFSRDGFVRLLAELRVAGEWRLMPAAKLAAGPKIGSNADFMHRRAVRDEPAAPPQPIFFA